VWPGGTADIRTPALLAAAYFPARVSIGKSMWDFQAAGQMDFLAQLAL
jgi:hypothetical protein